MQNGFGFVDYSNAAELLGLSIYTLKRWVSQKRISFYKIGSRVFFKPDELLNFVNRNRMESISVYRK